MWYYESKRNDVEVINKLEELSEKLPTRGFDEYYGRIRQEGYRWNRKRVLRVYRLLQLNLRKKRKRRLPARIKEPLEQPNGINHTWSMDFMSDSLIYGRRFRVLNIIDDYNREALAIESDFSLPAERVIKVLNEIIFWRGKPMKIRVDNGPEFISNALLKKYQSGDLRKSKYYKAQTASIYLLKKGGNNEYRCSFRTGEIYLNAAESAFRLQNKDNEGKAFLLKLLEHRLSANAYTKKVLQIDSMTNAELLAETLNQRELELAYEGHRWFDLRRLSQPKIEKQFGTENYVLNNNDVRYTLKIPAEAVSANPGLAN